MLLLILLALPFLISLNHYKPVLESQLTQLIGHPLTIGNLQLQMLPLPYLSAKGVSILGGQGHPGELFVHRMSLTPDVSQLIFAHRMIIRSIKLDGLATNQRLLQALIDQLQQRQKRPTDVPVAIEQVSAQNVSIRMDNNKLLGPYRFNIIFTPEYRIDHLQVQRMDGALDLQLDHSGMTYQTLIEAHDWTLPFKPALHFKHFRTYGVLNKHGLQLSHLQVAAYGGKLQGKAAISWQHHWQIAGQIQASAIRMAPLVQIFHGKGFAGRFSGKLKILLRANQARSLLHRPLITGNFTIDNGIISHQGSARPLLVFQQLTGNGTLKHSGLKTRDTVLHAYNGVIRGDTHTLWAPDWSFQAGLQTHDIDVEKLLAGFQQQHTLAGILTGHATVELAAKSFSGLFSRPAIKGHFSLRNGIVYQADLEKASVSLRKDVVGGQTKFSKLSADAFIKDGTVSLKQIQLKSTMLQARGQLAINQQAQLHGAMEVALRNTATLVSVPLRVRGTTTTPHLRPTTSVLIGGIVGTTVMGPGVGTALGIMITNKVGRLFDALTTTGQRAN